MPLPRFAKLPEPKRRAILTATALELAEHGIEGASFNRIIESAGISKGAIYYYFEDRDDLYLTVIEGIFDDVAADLPFPAPIETTSDFWREVETLYRAVVDRLRRDPDSIRILQRTTASLSRLMSGDRLASRLAGLQRFTATFLEDGRGVGAVRRDLPDALLVDLVFAVGEVLDRHMLASGALLDEASAATMVDVGMDQLRRLLAPTGPNPPETD